MDNQTHRATDPNPPEQKDLHQPNNANCPAIAPTQNQIIENIIPKQFPC